MQNVRLFTVLFYEALQKRVLGPSLARSFQKVTRIVIPLDHGIFAQNRQRKGLSTSAPISSEIMIRRSSVVNCPRGFLRSDVVVASR